MPILCIVYGCFHTMKAEWSSVTHKTKIFTLRASAEQFAGPGLNKSGQNMHVFKYI